MKLPDSVSESFSLLLIDILNSLGYRQVTDPSLGQTQLNIGYNLFIILGGAKNGSFKYLSKNSEEFSSES